MRDKEHSVSAQGHTWGASALCQAAYFLAAAVAPVVAISGLPEFFVISQLAGVGINGLERGIGDVFQVIEEP